MANTRTAPRQQRDALGLRLCRMPECRKPVPKGRRSYCSPACATAFEVAYFPSRTRTHVFERDRGVCSKCGCDTEKLRRIFEHACGRVAYLTYAQRRSLLYTFGRAAAAEAARILGFHSSYGRGGFWQADHIQECARGGWGKGLENFRTLCTPCHKSETARLARELADERKCQRDGGGLFSAPGKGASEPTNPQPWCRHAEQRALPDDVPR